jgi:hypothetical protein
VRHHLDAWLNLQAPGAVEYAPGRRGGEIDHNKPDPIVRRAAGSAIGDISDTSLLIDHDIIQEARLAVCHPIQGMLFIVLPDFRSRTISFCAPTGDSVSPATKPMSSAHSQPFLRST